MTAVQIAESIDQQLISLRAEIEIIQEQVASLPALQDQLAKLENARVALVGNETAPVTKPKRVYKKREKKSLVVQPTTEEATILESPVKTKLTQEIADLIRTDQSSVKSVAAFYGVSETTVRNIKGGRVWKPVRNG